MAYVLARHFASRLRCTAHARKNVDSCASVLQPGAYATHEESKAAVGREVWLAQQRAVDKYMDLRQSKSSVAERFLSKCLAPRKGFLIALTSTESAQPLSVTEMLATIVGDLQSRASNQFPQDQTWKAEMQNSVGTIRRSGARPQCLGPSAVAEPIATPYTRDEVDLVIESFKTGKRCLGLPYAALKATNSAGRALTCALANLGRHMCLTSTHWSLRQYGPIRKCGPRIVRSV